MEVDDQLSWDDLQKMSEDKDVWRAKVNEIKAVAQRTTKTRKTKTAYINLNNSPKARITFVSKAAKVKEKTEKQKIRKRKS